MLEAVYREEYISIYEETDFFFEDVEICSREFKRLVDYFTGTSEYLCSIVNRISNQGISEINCVKYTYVIGDKELPFDCFSRSEKLFLAVALALSDEMWIYLGECATLLYHKNLHTLNDIVKEYSHGSKVICVPPRDKPYFVEEVRELNA